MRTPTRERREISVRGIVQGVGFRPFIYSLARRHGLVGLVRNDAEGVHIEAEGAPEALELFVREIEEKAPPLAVVEAVAWRPLAVQREEGFRIEESREGVRRRALISPDIATCGECLAELFDPTDRRYRYPFTNCTNCGPRFTITRSVPYDRAMTTMAHFEMCPECRSEYDDPSDRRFHAQPNACPVCGPRVRLLDRFGHELRGKPDDPILRAARMLRGRAILAIKGLGGYHLACDPFDEGAVRTLRGRKVRQDKPFALMARDLDQARELCRVGPEEERLLTSPARPIVLLERREDNGVAEEVAPRQNSLGVMLAYTPLHHLLLRDAGMPLVMTSGNNSDEPIAFRDGEAFEQLGEIADYFLIHDRPIHMRCDDSVARAVEGKTYPLRRSRGYAPAPLGVAESFGRHTLACGGELKNTFCVAKERHVFLSHHIGDLENYETLRSFTEGVEHYCRLFDAVAALACLPGTQRATYEGQAAIELELAAEGPASRGYPFRLRREGEGWVVETGGILGGVVEDLLAGHPAGAVSSRFHRTMAEVVVAGCEEIRSAGGPGAVALSGGTFQNLLLMEQVLELLAGKDFTVYRHARVPTNDGGLALGQAVLANSEKG